MHNEMVKIAGLILTKGAAILLGVVALISVLSIMLGG